jgi:hypothetical protein
VAAQLEAFKEGLSCVNESVNELKRKKEHKKENEHGKRDRRNRQIDT